jgi:hypothetical protein
MLLRVICTRPPSASCRKADVGVVTLTGQEPATATDLAGVTALDSAPALSFPARDRLALPARALLGLAAAIAALAPLLFGAYAFTSTGGEELGA